MWSKICAPKSIPLSGSTIKKSNYVELVFIAENIIAKITCSNYLLCHLPILSSIILNGLKIVVRRLKSEVGERLLHVILARFSWELTTAESSVPCWNVKYRPSLQLHFDYSIILLPEKCRESARLENLRLIIP